MQLRFTKMHGLGNDFVVVDTLSQDCSLGGSQVRKLADRHRGVGCDQVLLIEPPQDPEDDFFYRIFNADGGEVEQCGNGARCLGKYVSDKKLTGKRNLRVSTLNSKMYIDILGGSSVRVNMGEPSFELAAIPFGADTEADSYTIAYEGGQVEASVLSMGNPHAVIVVEDVDQAPVATLGPQLQAHQQFANSVNVGFMQVLSRGSIRLRVYERGAGETQACGTGACAAVVAGRKLGLLDEEVDVALRGGKLRIGWKGEGHAVMMTGEAVRVFDGKMRL